MLRARYFIYEFTLQVVGALYALIGLLMVGGIPSLVIHSGTIVSRFDKGIRTAMTLGLLGVAIVCVVLGPLLMATGFGLRNLRSKYRVWAVVPTIALLFVVPVGTLLGIVTLGVLSSNAGRYLFTADYRQVMEAAPRHRVWAWASWLTALLLLPALKTWALSRFQR